MDGWIHNYIPMYTNIFDIYIFFLPLSNLFLLYDFILEFSATLFKKIVFS